MHTPPRPAAVMEPSALKFPETGADMVMIFCWILGREERDCLEFLWAHVLIFSGLKLPMRVLRFSISREDEPAPMSFFQPSHIDHDTQS